MMEKVWDELKKIEAKAEQIKNDASEKSKQIVAAAEQKSERLIANAKEYANDEASRQHEAVLKEANDSRDRKKAETQKTLAYIRQEAEKRLDKASEKIVEEIIGEAPNASREQVR